MKTPEPLTYLSVCSGIEAATVAWHPLGFQAVAYSEISPFPSAVLQHHYPTVPNLGSLTEHDRWQIDTPDILVGGTPCQDFSIAGLRAGMAGRRGALTLAFVRLAARLLPRWIVWENVPGVLSSNRGRDFGAFLGALAQLGYGFAYRVLDAQFFGVAQRRRRVFVVGCLGDWRAAGAVLFEPESLRRHPAESRKARQSSASPVVAGTVASRHAGGFQGVDEACQGLLVPFDPTQITSATNRCQPVAGDPCHPLAATARAPVLAFSNTAGDTALSPSATHCLPISCRNGDPGLIATQWSVRRITPREAERLQGFPDDYTAITYRGKPAADSPRYKALGNSMAVPVMRWIGKRIQAVEGIK